MPDKWHPVRIRKYDKNKQAVSLQWIGLRVKGIKGAALCVYLGKSLKNSNDDKRAGMNVRSSWQKNVESGRNGDRCAKHSVRVDDGKKIDMNN